MPLTARQEFCEALASVMHTSKIEEVGYSSLEKAIGVALRQDAVSADDLERFKNDLKTCSFLTRIGTGDQFRFAHKSFLEFFVACRVARHLDSPAASPQPEQKVAKGTIAERGAGQRPRARAADQAIKTSSALPLLSTVAAPHVGLDWRSLEYSVIGRRSFLQGISSSWGTTYSLSDHTPYRSELETQMDAVLNLRKEHKAPTGLHITEEIATFVVELLDNRSVAIDRVLSARPEAEDGTIAEVLRLSKAKDYVRKHTAYITKYISSCKAPATQVALAAALARSAETVEAEFIASLRSMLSADGFTYVLFELAARRANIAMSAFEAILAIEDLRALDRVICRHGLDQSLPADERNLVTPGLVASLLGSEEEAEFQLGVTLLDSVELYNAFAVLKRAFQRARDPLTKSKLIDAMRRDTAEANWKNLRVLAQGESDKKVRVEILGAEEALRNRVSASTVRSGWNPGSADRRLRESLWKMLRNH